MIIFRQEFINKLGFIRVFNVNISESTTTVYCKFEAHSLLQSLFVHLYPTRTLDLKFSSWLSDNTMVKKSTVNKSN